MEMFVEISFYVVAMILIIFMVMLIIIANRDLYCAIYHHEDRKLWKYLIENAFQFKQTYETEKVFGLSGMDTNYLYGKMMN